MQTSKWAAAAIAACVSFSTLAQLPGPRSTLQGSELFLGGNYIELGISQYGDFGTTGNKPGSFFGTPGENRIGMSADHDGFGVGQNLAVDYYLPGDPEERFAYGYRIGATTATRSNSALGGGSNLSTTVTNLSSGSTLGARTVTTWSGVMEVTQVISFHVDDKYFKNEVTLRNLSSDDWDGARYMRSVDPDNTVSQGGSFATENTVIGTFDENGFAAVEAKTYMDHDPLYLAGFGRAPIVFFSETPGARASIFGFMNTDPYAPAAYDSPATPGVPIFNDVAITMTWDSGLLPAGESTSFIYYTSLDDRAFEEVLADIIADVSFAPTLFIENADDDGGIGTVSTAKLRGDTFTGADGEDFFTNGKASHLGAPAGLTPRLIRSGDDTAELSFGGNATQHDPADDVADFRVIFAAEAFAAGNAARIRNSTTTGLRIVFMASDNHAPDGLGHLILASVPKNASAPAGALPADMDGFAFSDPDDDAFGGLLIIGNAAGESQGLWQYSSDNGLTWSAIGEVSAQAGLSLSAATRIRFLPAEDFSGVPGALTVRALDENATAFSDNSLIEEHRVILDGRNNGGATFISSGTWQVVTRVTAAPAAAGALVLNLPVLLSTMQDTELAISGISVDPIEIGEGTLLMTFSVPAGSGTLTADSSNGVTAAGSGTAALTLVGTRNDLHDYLGAGAVRFMPAPWRDTPVSLAVSVSDQGFGPALEELTDDGAIPILIVGVNDAPHLSLLDFQLGELAPDEDSPVFTVGALLDLAGFDDPDTGDARGMAIIRASGNGVWQYSTDGITWRDFPSGLGASNALLLAEGTRLRFLSPATASASSIQASALSETIGLRFRGWDRTSGTASTNALPRFGDTTGNGGNTAYSTQVAEFRLSASVAAQLAPIPIASSWALLALSLLMLLIGCRYSRPPPRG